MATDPATLKPFPGNVTGSARGVRVSGGAEVRFDTAAGPGAVAGLFPKSDGAGGITWATPGATSGGTGFTTWTSGDMLYADATNSLAKRAKGSDGQVWTLVSGLPNWATPAAGGPTTLFGGTKIGAGNTGGTYPYTFPSAFGSTPNIVASHYSSGIASGLYPIVYVKSATAMQLLWFDFNGNQSTAVAGEFIAIGN